jgi:hypothetical protein
VSVAAAGWRIGCLRIPRFAIGAAWGHRAGRGEPSPVSHTPHEPRHWDDRLIGLVTDGRVKLVTNAAARLRVADIALAAARKRCPELELLAWDDLAIEREVERVTSVLLGVSAHVAPVPGAPGSWWVAAESPNEWRDDEGLARALVRTARLWHPAPRVAIASSCVAARAAVWAPTSGATTIVRPGHCASFLSSAPLGLIAMDDDSRELFRGIGLRTAGALAALEQTTVARRAGAAGLAAWRLARGDDPSRPLFERRLAAREASAGLGMPTTSVEPVFALARPVLDRLARALATDGRAAATIALTVTADRRGGPAAPRRTITREAQLTDPIARLRPLLDVCRSLLERSMTGERIHGLTIGITATVPSASKRPSSRGGPPTHVPLRVASWCHATRELDLPHARRSRRSV